MQAINFEQNCAPHWGRAQGYVFFGFSNHHNNKAVTYPHNMLLATAYISSHQELTCSSDFARIN
jgi:hypothetical protein